MVSVRRARPNETERVATFYKETAYGAGVNPDDVVLVAERGSELVGAVRLCEEFGAVVLRGMRVRASHQRQGIGTALLAAAEKLLGDRSCYCIPYRHLQAFYGQAGFVEIPPAQAPQGLQERLADYQGRGLDVTIMRRRRSIPKTVQMHPYQALEPAACRVLAAALGEAPETIISVHVLRQGRCTAYAVGDPAHFEAAIVQAHDAPAEPVGFGSDPRLLWQLLQSVKGWECILVDAACAPLLGGIIEQETDLQVRYLHDVYHILDQPAATYRDPVVRRLSLDDLALLQSAPHELRAGCWNSLHSLLCDGIIACAVVAEQIVATALTTARGEQYADVGVYTQPDFRGRGLASAAASMVAQAVQTAGQLPVWSAGEHNEASLRLARKLGFREVLRRIYVIPT